MARQEEIARALIDANAVEEPGASRKYRRFRDPSGAFWFVGRAGAIRRGKTIAGSVSYTSRAEQVLDMLAGRARRSREQAQNI